MTKQSGAGTAFAPCLAQPIGAGESTFARLIAVSCLRDPHTDTYVNPNGRTALALAEERRLRADHEALFRKFLGLRLGEMTGEVRSWLAHAGQDSSKVLDAWRRFETYRAIPPHAATDLERDLFLAEITLVVASLMKEVPSRRRLSLTAREAQVLSCLARGLTSKEIADRLAISLHTVGNHRRRLAEKIGTKGAAGLVAYAARVSPAPCLASKSEGVAPDQRDE